MPGGSDPSGTRVGSMELKIKSIVAVASGKGGVGKSTVAANLALALQKQGLKVGLMDADVYGPSIPTILGIREKPQMAGQRIIPVNQCGLKVISMGFFVPANEAVIWRGPMLHKMVQDFLGTVEWGELDALIVDLPPGTGDIQLSLCQTIPLTGALIVSTPQDVAWNVAQKAIVMFDKLNTPVLGVVENMSGEVFGRGGARRAAELLGIPFLGEVALLPEIRMRSDRGEPANHYFTSIAKNLTLEIERQKTRQDSKKAPVKISPPLTSQLEIEWNDGKKTAYTARDLRLACPCAACVNEINGQRTLKPDSVPQEIKILSRQTVGRYALNIAFSDGHATGLYGFEYLRKLAG